MSEVNKRPYHHGRLRSALLAAAERTLREHGEDQLSLRELAREIGVSHAAPRRHFPDRQALCDALAVAGFQRLHEQLRNAFGSAETDFASRLRAVVEAYVHFGTNDAALLGLMFTSKHRPGAEHVLEAADPPMALMYELIEQGQEAGVLARGDSKQAGIVLIATMQGIATLINSEMVKPELLDGLVDKAVEQFSRGARPV